MPTTLRTCEVMQGELNDADVAAYLESASKTNQLQDLYLCCQPKLTAKAFTTLPSSLTSLIINECDQVDVTGLARPGLSISHKNAAQIKESQRIYRLAHAKHEQQQKEATQKDAAKKD